MFSLTCWHYSKNQFGKGNVVTTSFTLTHTITDIWVNTCNFIWKNMNSYKLYYYILIGLSESSLVNIEKSYCTAPVQYYFDKMNVGDYTFFRLSNISPYIMTQWTSYISSLFHLFVYPLEFVCMLSIVCVFRI